MKITKSVLACLAMLAFFVLTTSSARAADVDCGGSTPQPACNFGTQLVTYTLTNVPLAGGSGSHSAQFSESVYKNGSGIYTYVFAVNNLNSNFLDTLSTFANSGSGDGFSCSGLLDCGVVGLGTGGSTVNDTSFIFNAGSLVVNFGQLLGPNNQFEFYVQSTGAPVAGQFNTGDKGSTLYDPSWNATPEPGVLTLLGSLLLVLLLGAPLATRLRTRTA